MTDSGATLDQRVTSQQGLVRAIALKIHRRATAQVELDDLIGYGQIGLAEAARDFDPSRGCQFSTFAYHRVRGAILDGLRHLTWFRRATPAWAGPQAAADDRWPDLCDSKADDATGWLHETVANLALVFLFSQASSGSEGPREPAGESPAGPDVEVGRQELHAIVRRLASELPADEARVIETVYFEGETIAEAARRLGIGKPWASRLHARALETLSRALRRLDLAD